MPWMEATLKGNRVFARARADGTLVADGGRVEIRYRLGDERSYRAAIGNLIVVSGGKVLPDPPTASPSELETPAGRSSRGKPVGSRDPAVPAHPAQAWIAYADGACSGNPGPAGCGVVIVSPAGEQREGFEYIGQATNNVAELTAILRAIDWMPDARKTTVIYTDSQYAIGVLQKGWKAKANQELVARAKDAVRARGAQLVYVPGHAGVALNERADALARQAVQERASQAPPLGGQAP